MHLMREISRGRAAELGTPLYSLLKERARLSEVEDRSFKLARVREMQTSRMLEKEISQEDIPPVPAVSGPFRRPSVVRPSSPLQGKSLPASQQPSVGPDGQLQDFWSSLHVDQEGDQGGLEDEEHEERSEGEGEAWEIPAESSFEGPDEGSPEGDEAMQTVRALSDAPRGVSVANSSFSEDTLRSTFSKSKQSRQSTAEVVPGFGRAGRKATLRSSHTGDLQNNLIGTRFVFCNKVFNRKLLQELQKYWHTLGVTASDNGTKDEAIAVGCPMFMKGKAEWPGSCSQDIIYPALAWDILPKISKQKVMTLGDPGCGHPSKFQNKELPLGCWEMQQNPLGGESLQGELKAIRVLADMETESYCVAHGDPLAKNCKKFHDGRHVAVIHHVNNLAVHSLARQLLDHETVGAVASSTAAGAVAGAAPLQTAVSTSKAPAPFLATASPTAGVLNEVRKQYRKCDGHLFFTDTASPNKTDEEDFVRIIVPQQRLARGHGQWLYHRNMEGNNEDKLAVDGPIMLMWGNAFVFNRKFVQALKEHWPVVGQVASTDNQTSKEGRAVGCPLFMKGRSEWPDSCSQDIIYPTLAMNVLPPLKVKVAFPGASGCGQHSKNRKNRDRRGVFGCQLQKQRKGIAISSKGSIASLFRSQEYPLGCWEMQQNPLQGESEAGELAAIKDRNTLTPNMWAKKLSTRPSIIEFTAQ
eukprot:g14762.t1